MSNGPFRMSSNQFPGFWCLQPTIPFCRSVSRLHRRHKYLPATHLETMYKIIYLFNFIFFNAVLVPSAAFVPVPAVAVESRISSSSVSRRQRLLRPLLLLGVTKKTPRSAGLPDRLKQNHEKWQPFFDLLRQFQSTHGHCNLTEADDSALYLWVEEQRSSYRNLKLGRKTKLTKTRAAALEMIGAIPADLLDL